MKNKIVNSLPLRIFYDYNLLSFYEVSINTSSRAESNTFLNHVCLRVSIFNSASFQNHFYSVILYEIPTRKYDNDYITQSGAELRT